MLVYFGSKIRSMQQVVIQRLYKDKYSTEMSIDDYISHVALGLQLIKTTLLGQSEHVCKAINLALEFNIELMATYIMIDNDTIESQQEQFFPSYFHVKALRKFN
jgi:hypothetical protein